MKIGNKNNSSGWFLKNKVNGSTPCRFNKLYLSNKANELYDKASTRRRFLKNKVNGGTLCRFKKVSLNEKII